MDIIWGHFLYCWKIGIKFEYTISRFAVITAIITDCINSCLKMLSVLTLGLIFIEEIEPCQFEIENVSVASCKIVTFFKIGSFKIRATGDFNLPLVWSLRSDTRCNIARNGRIAPCVHLCNSCVQYFMQCVRSRSEFYFCNISRNNCTVCMPSATLHAMAWRNRTLIRFRWFRQSDFAWIFVYLFAFDRRKKMAVNAHWTPDEEDILMLLQR